MCVCWVSDAMISLPSPLCLKHRVVRMCDHERNEFIICLVNSLLSRSNNQQFFSAAFATAVGVFVVVAAMVYAANSCSKCLRSLLQQH